MKWGRKICLNNPGHMSNMAAMPIYSKNVNHFLLWNQRPMTLKVGIRHRVIEYYHICSNDAPGLTLTYFMARSYLVPYAIFGGKR